MLELATTKHTLDFKLDGKTYSIPLELTLPEMREMGLVAQKLEKSSDIEKIEMVEWFCSFAAKYSTKELKNLSAEAVSVVFNEWNAEREKQLNISAGEH